MAATTTTTANDAGASATGYEAFIKDSGDTSTHNLEAMVDEDVAQIKITSHYPQKLSAGEKTNTDAAGEEAPALTASSSSDESQINETQEEAQKSKLSDWADKFSSQCQMDTACGKLEVEFMKKDEAPASRANALAEKGELLAIEDLPRPEPWTARQVSDATTEILSTVSTKVSTKASDLMVALGLATKKEQNLMTDYYEAKPAPEETEKEPEKSLSEKALALQNSVTTKTEALKESVMSTLGLVPEEKEMKQQLMTDFDPDSLSNVPAQLTEDDVMSICTEKPLDSAPMDADAVAETQPAPVEEKDEKIEKSKDEKVEKSSWKIWEQLKGFMSKFKLPEKAQSTPKIETPSFALFSCNPTVAATISNEDGAETVEETKADETKIEKETKPEEAEKVEDTKAEHTEPETPKNSATPW